MVDERGVKIFDHLLLNSDSGVTLLITVELGGF
jgi:hypothetical protein